VPIRTVRHPLRGPWLFADLKSSFDALVLRLFLSKTIRRMLREQTKMNLESVWARCVHELDVIAIDPKLEIADTLEIHRKIVEGLPGEALFISSAMVFDSLNEALPFFDVSAKTARLRLGELLTANEGEIALRIGRVLTMAADVLGTLDAARTYLRTPNFALGGAIPRDLLKTAEGEHLVLNELQTQREGGPV